MGEFPMADTLIELKNVSLDFETAGTVVHAVQNASCRVQSGSVIAITGPSGSGKSTLLALMGGLDAASSGEIRWPMWGAANTLRPRHIGMAFQSSSLLPSLTVLENVELPLLMLGEKTWSASRALEALGLLRLDHLASRLPAELSGGQMQRVAFARALVTKPSVVLADEPTGQLDQTTAQDLMSQVLSAIQDTGTTLVVATHDLVLADSFATQWQMNFGQLTTPTQLKAKANA
jgi:ABC-type lipoprotein export system ATPase subunit